MFLVAWQTPEATCDSRTSTHSAISWVLTKSKMVFILSSGTAPRRSSRRSLTACCLRFSQSCCSHFVTPVRSCQTKQKYGNKVCLFIGSWIASEMVAAGVVQDSKVNFILHFHSGYTNRTLAREVVRLLSSRSSMHGQSTMVITLNSYWSKWLLISLWCHGGGFEPTTSQCKSPTYYIFPNVSNSEMTEFKSRVYSSTLI